MSNIKRRFVLCANLRAIPALADGRERASDWIRYLGAQLPEHGGQQVKPLNDGLLAVFSQSTQALSWALKMREQWASDMPWTLQMGISVGDVVEWSGDCFGDAVNVASGLLEQAQAGETLLSEEIYQALPWEGQVWLYPLAKTKLPGRLDSVQMYRLLDQPGDPPPALLPASAPPLSRVRGLRLEFEDRELRFSAREFPISLGRSSHCTVPIENARVSRTHARIDLTSGVLELTDLSVNGTFVVVDNSQQIMPLRRGFCTLEGQGSVGLGGTPDNRRASTFRYVVLLEAPAEADFVATEPANYY